MPRVTLVMAMDVMEQYRGKETIKIQEVYQAVNLSVLLQCFTVSCYDNLCVTSCEKPNILPK